MIAIAHLVYDKVLALITEDSYYHYFLTAILYYLKAQSDTVEIDSASLLDDLSYYEVDTTIHRNLVRSLKGFLKAKNSGSLNNPYVHPDYLEEDPEPFQHFLNNEYQEPDGSYLFKARVLRLLPVATDTWLIKLIWLGTRKESRGAYFDRLGGLIVKRIGAKYYFYNKLEYEIKSPAFIGVLHFFELGDLRIEKALILCIHKVMEYGDVFLFSCFY